MKTAGLSTNIDELHDQINLMVGEIRRLKEQLYLATRRQFGSSSETFSPDQQSLFSSDDIDIVIVETEIEEDIRVPDEPKPKKKLRQAIVVDKNTPIERCEPDLDDNEKNCSCCGGALHKIGEDCSYQVEYITAQTKVIETARPEYGCLAHCRRYFFEASELEVEPGVAHEALKIFSLLYDIERDIKHYCDKKRKKQRRLRSKPLLKKFHRWLIKQKSGRLKKGKLTAAINYALNHWRAFTRYCDAGYLEIDNNYSEREMKPIALGRNYLFVGSLRGGRAAATLYGIIESAKANGHNVYGYLKDVLERLPGCNDEQLASLLPHYWSPSEAS